MTLTYGELFAGVGGFGLGFDRAGLEPRWQVEIDPIARSVLNRHWPDVPRYSDVREVGASNLEHVDVISFGSPCQDMSVAGKRAGLDGARSGLFHEAARVIRELRPAYAIWENVPGALSSSRGRDFGAVLDALANAGALDIAWRVLDARWFGVAQRRRRLFVVADFRARRAGQILFEREGSGGRLASGGEARQDVACTSGGRSSSAGITPEVAYSLRAASGGSSERGDLTLVANSVQASAGHHGHSSPRGDGSDNLIAISESGPGWWREGIGPLRAEGENRPSRPSTLIALDTTQITSRGNYSNPKPGDPCHPLAAGAKSPAVAFNHIQDPVSGDACPTLGQDGMAVSSGLLVRRLTPRGCERLMGWPDDWSRWAADGHEITDSHRYRMCGNGVVSSVSEWLARRLVTVDARLREEATA